MKFASLVAALTLSLPAGIASAQNSYTMVNTTTVDGSNNVAYTYPNNYIGSDFQTLSLTVAQTGTTATMSYITAFSGSETVLNYSVGYADVFFGGVWAGIGMSMGYQTVTGTGNGGVTEGMYQVQGASTSNDIWSQRSGIYYGAGYGPNDTAVDTVITTGKFISSIPMSFTTAQIGGGLYDVTFTLRDLDFNMVTDFENGSLSALWGTGDCANGAFVAVPEPDSLGLYAGGALALSYLLSRWKMRRN